MTEQMTQQEPPNRIYGWRNTGLSVARFYGGLKYQGYQYNIAVDEEGQPLVRADVLRREAREKAARLNADGKAQKLAAAQAQGAPGASAPSRHQITNSSQKQWIGFC